MLVDCAVCLNGSRFPNVDDGDDGAAALRALVHGVDGNEHRRIANGCCRNAADGGLGMTMMMDVRVIKHDLPPMPQRPAAVGLAFDKTVHETPVEIGGAWPIGKLKPCATDRRIDRVDVEGVAHHRMSD